MGSRYLTDLANVVRSAGLPTIEVEGWHYRARGSGGYDSGRPDHVMVHHTASGPSSDGWPDVNYCTYHDDDAPLCNLYINRGGHVWVCAGGATNTNGSGRCPHCGTTDNMNSRAIGIEAGNNGVGELWPNAQEDAYVRLVRALCSHYGITNAAVRSHFEYAPDRKTDPLGPDRWAAGAAMWNMGSFRSDVAAPPPKPKKGRKAMRMVQQSGDTAVWVSDMVTKRWCNNTDGQTAEISRCFSEIGLPDDVKLVSAGDMVAYGVIAAGSPIPPPPPGYSGRDWLGRPTK